MVLLAHGLTEERKARIVLCCRLHAAQEESFCSVELRRYPCSNLQVKVAEPCTAPLAYVICHAQNHQQTLLLEAFPAVIQWCVLCTMSGPFKHPLATSVAWAGARRQSLFFLGMQVTFADAASTAKSITFAHGKSPGVWEKLGSMPLKSHGSSCLQHVIKLGAHTQVQRYLRVTLQGLLHPIRDSSSFHGTAYS